eukprot:3884347-Rhodomonas_salina.1
MLSAIRVVGKVGASKGTGLSPAASAAPSARPPALPSHLPQSPVPSRAQPPWKGSRTSAEAGRVAASRAPGVRERTPDQLEPRQSRM